jgi:hypothetical protein
LMLLFTFELFVEISSLIPCSFKFGALCYVIPLLNKTLLGGGGSGSSIYRALHYYIY